MYKSKNPMLNVPDELAAQIKQVTDHQIDELILLVSRQFNLLRPEREGMFLSLSQDPQKRDEELKELVRLLRLHPKGTSSLRSGRHGPKGPRNDGEI